MLLNIFIAINYGSLALLLYSVFGNFALIYFVNSFIWCVSLGLLYFEYRRKFFQAWIGLRGFWISNGMIYLGRIIFFYIFTEIEPELAEFNLLFIVQAFISILLTYLAIFKPRDHETKINPLMDDLNPNTSSESFPANSSDPQNKVSSNKNANANQGGFNLIELQIVEIRARKFSKQGDALIPINREDEKFLENTKLRFNIRFQIPNSMRRRVSSKTGKVKEKGTHKKFFFSKKSLKEISEFNSFILEKYEKKNINSTVCPLMIQLKNLTNIFMQKILTPTDLNSSSISSQGGYSSKIQTLQQLYINLCKNYSFFTKEFLKFLDVQDDELFEILMKQFENEKTNFNFKIGELAADSIRGEENKTEDKSFVSGKSNKTPNSSKNISCRVNIQKDKDFESFHSDFDQLLDTGCNNDVLKTMIFISNVITSECFISIHVQSLKESTVFKDSTIVCDLILAASQDEITELKNSPIQINISLKKIFDLVKKGNTKSNPKKLSALKAIVKDMKTILLINKESSDVRGRLSIIFTSLVNDLFYLDDHVFTMLELNKIMKLEYHEIDMQIVTSFFELNRKSSLNILTMENCILKERNLCNFRFFLELDRVEKIETMQNENLIILSLSIRTDLKENIKDNMNFASWDADICINDLLNTISEIIDVCSLKSIFCELVKFLKGLRTNLRTLLQLLKVESFSILSLPLSNKLSSSGTSSNENEGKSISSNKSSDECLSLLIEIIQQFEKFFVPPYIYLLYSQEVRNMFCLSYLFKKESLSSKRKEQPVSGSSSSILDNLLK